MLQTSQTDYTSVLSEFLQCQIKIFGPQIVHAKIGEIKGLTCDKDGVVKKLVGDPQSILQEVATRLGELSEYAVKGTLDRIVRNHAVSGMVSAPDISRLNNTQEDILSTLPVNASQESSA